MHIVSMLNVGIIAGILIHKLNMNLAYFTLTWTCVVILHNWIYMSCYGCIKIIFVNRRQHANNGTRYLKAFWLQMVTARKTTGPCRDIVIVILTGLLQYSLTKS